MTINNEKEGLPMLTVLYTDLGEFLAELRSSRRDNVRLRATMEFRMDSALPIQSVSIVAGFHDPAELGEIVLLHYRVGNKMQGEKSDVAERAEKAMALIRDTAADLKMDLKAGRYQYPDQPR